MDEPATGPSQDGTPPRFQGTLELNVSGKAREKGCFLQGRWNASGNSGTETPPRYQCYIAVEASFASASADYNSIAAKLRACLPETEFADYRTGKNDTPRWLLTGRIEGAEIYLMLLDPYVVAARFADANVPEQERFTVALGIKNTQFDTRKPKQERPKKN